jgi:hypothetical protein
VILKGSQRGGAGQLAAHLLKLEENEHVDVHELRGFAAEDLKAAFHEAYGMSRGTRCKQFLFSLSLNPPAHERVSTQAFEAAITRIEARLGLAGQPRAIVFHEKEGRRHAHVVWSRIDAEGMKAINLPHFKLKLREVSKELYRAHGWRMPSGLIDSRARDPLNFTRQEWQQARRTGQDPKALKALFQECWAASRTREELAQALKERGFVLARGDRRAFVALDWRGEVYALSRLVGIRTREVTSRLGDPEVLPTLSEAKGRLSLQMRRVVEGYLAEARAARSRESAALSERKAELVQRHREERTRLDQAQEARWVQETAARAQRLRRGFQGLWDRLTGTYGRIRALNEKEARAGYLRDRTEKEALIQRQITQRRALQQDILRARQENARQRQDLEADIAHYVELGADGGPGLSAAFREAARPLLSQSQARERAGGGARSAATDTPPPGADSPAEPAKRPRSRGPNRAREKGRDSGRDKGPDLTL